MMSNWLGGCNSMLPPDQIGQAQYSWAVNCVNRGGIVQTRPGENCIASVLGDKVQGGCIFTPKASRPMMLLAVDGNIFVAKYPFFSFSQVNGLKFSAAVPIVNFQPVLKSVKLNDDGSLAIIDPKPLMIIQDGTTRAGVFDGSTGVHSKAEAPFFGIPIGLWMAWTSSRLWVFAATRGYVSDLANPDTFSENSYLAERSNFELPADVTGCIETTDQTALLVFTTTTTTAFQSNILNRTLWGTTPYFQKVVLPSIGCVSGRSPINQYGLTWWMSRAGLINMNAATYTLRSSILVSVDGEMARSKRIMSPDMSGVVTAFFENYLLCSVPAGGKYNEHTWVMDQAAQGGVMSAAQQFQSSTTHAWASIWTGTRPVQWMKTEYGGREHIYFVSYDKTAKDGTHIHVWEAFKDDRRDNDGRIACQMETALLLAPELQRFRYAEIEFTEILGPVELTVFIGGRRGPWLKVGSTTYQAEIGSIGSPIQKIIHKSTILQSFKPQSREFKTQQFSTQGRDCVGVESKDSPGKDKGFQLLLEWKGRLGVKRIKMFMDEESSANVGKCEGDEIGKVNMVNDAGETIAYPV